MSLHLDRYKKVKTTKHYEIWLEKDPTNPKQRQVLIHYLSYSNRWIQATVSESLFKMFFKPDEYKKVFMTDRQRGQ